MEPAISVSEKYQQLNQRKKRKLIFQLTKRGFASEINNMLSAILYCLVNDIEFVIYSKSWVAGYEKGWIDYFKPFCRENSNIFYYRRNVFYLDEKLGNLASFIETRLPKKHLTAFDIWSEIRSKEFFARDFDIPELEIRGDIFHAKKAILEMLYQYNDQTSTEVNAQQALLNEMKPYISIHIRRGDKVETTTKESDAVDISVYVNKIKEITPEISTIFLATDDYRTYEELELVSPPHWNITSFCKKNTTGYDSQVFNKAAKDYKKQHMLALFRDLHFLVESDHFIGTYSSNIGRLVALFKGRDKCHSCDISTWVPD